MVRSIYSNRAIQHKNPVPNAAVHRGVMITSAILGQDPQTGAYFADKARQFESVFEQLEAILAEAGATTQDVVKLDLYLTDKSDRSLVNPHWIRLWPDDRRRPARQAHQAVLPEGCVVQIVATAVLAEAGDQ